jgi:stage II sporulation protein D
MRVLLTFIMVLASRYLGAVELEIRLFSTLNLTQTTVIPDSGDYFLIALDRELRPIDTIIGLYEPAGNKLLHFLKNGNIIKTTHGDFAMGSYHALRITSRDQRKEFRIQAAGKERVYRGDLRLRLHEGYLQLVNLVDIENYVAGVVESEGGHLDNPEYFKAQAVLARTFALKNLNKHSAEGYNLKDDVTSQVYFSRPRYKHARAILEAVKATEDTIVVTAECEPILGVFHANSGGVCTNSEDVWLQPVEYLRSRVDSFSIGVGSYTWEREMEADEFYGYFARHLGVKDDAFLRKAILNLQHNPRQAYFEYQGKKLKLTKVRHHFNLRSTFFEVYEHPNSKITLKGRGYGHGVGLSQDGAMEMARQGYDYREIIDFYFAGVELESIGRIDLSLAHK